MTDDGSKPTLARASRVTAQSYTASRPTIVVAYDGLIADTLPRRASAVVEGIHAVGFVVDADAVRDMVAGRTIGECVRLALGMQDHAVDETTIDIATLRAIRINSLSMRQPTLLLDGALPWLQRAAVSSRVIIRADSERAHVEPVLDASGLAEIVSLIVCSDDVAGASIDVPMFDTAWQMIIRRSAASGTHAEHIHGLECASSELSSRVDAVRIHRVTSITHVAHDALQLS